MRILYVEDDLSMAKAVEGLLSQVGYKLDPAHSGQEAIDLARSRAYDLLLIDTDLPDMGGDEVLERLRGSGINLPCVMQRRSSQAMEKGAADRLGVSGYLKKPFNKNDLIRAIEDGVAHNTPDTPVARLLEAGRALMTGDNNHEDRRDRRHKTLRAARVVWPSMFNCVVLDMSAGGAALRLPYAQQALPQVFSLSVKAAPQLKCEVCWRAGDKAGVKFI